MQIEELKLKLKLYSEDSSDHPPEMKTLQHQYDELEKQHSQLQSKHGELEKQYITTDKIKTIKAYVPEKVRIFIATLNKITKIVTLWG